MRIGTISRVCLVALLPAIAVLVGCSQRSATLEQAREPVLYPLPPGSARVAYLTSINDSSVFGRESHRLTRFLFGREAEAGQTITKPFGLAAGHDTLLVCDTQQNVVHVFDFKQGRCDTLGAGGRGRLLKPVAVTMDDQANRYVADALRGEVVVFSPENRPIRAFGRAGDEPFKPVAIAFHDGRLWVLNAAAHRVEVMNPDDGELIASFGEKGSGLGQMLWPGGLAVDDEGRAYVTDMLNFRVQSYGPDGVVLDNFGSPGDRAGQFSRPKHLAVAPDGIIYVVDAGFQRVQMFDDQGRVLMLFGGPGPDPGSMTLPGGICIDRSLLPYFADYLPRGFEADYLVFVSDQFGPRKVNVYAFGRMNSAPNP